MLASADDRDVLRAIAAAVGHQTGPIALHEPSFKGREWEYVKECLDTKWVSSAGRFVELFEQRLQDCTGAQSAVAVCNGTAALHLSLVLIGIEPGDEVLVPALTFVATANAVAQCGAVPHLVDSDERSLGIDPVKLANHLRLCAERSASGCMNRYTGRRIRAVVPMHCFGHPVDMEPLLEVAGHYSLTVIEDAAEALGSRYKGRAAGTIGRLGVLSFNGNKIATTGGGGAILTNDAELGRRAKHLSATARVPHPWAYAHDDVAYNYRMPNINAALGCAQLENLPDFIEAKRRLLEQYRKAFSGLRGMKIFVEAGYAYSNYWLNALILDSDEAFRRDRLLAAAHEQGFHLRPAWTLMHRLPMYTRCPRMDLTTAEDLERRLISLPSSAFFGRE